MITAAACVRCSGLQGAVAGLPIARRSSPVQRVAVAHPSARRIKPARTLVVKAFKESSKVQDWRVKDMVDVSIAASLVLVTHSLFQRSSTL